MIIVNASYLFKEHDRRNEASISTVTYTVEAVAAAAHCTLPDINHGAQIASRGFGMMKGRWGAVCGES